MSSDITAGAMGAPEAATRAGAKKPLMERVLDGIERVGNKVPHPVLMFLYLIVGVIVLSQILAFAGVSVTEEVVVPAPYSVAHNYYEDTTQVQAQVPAEVKSGDDTVGKFRTPVRDGQSVSDAWSRWGCH